MTWGRKSAILMLVAAVSWIVLPASACLLGTQTAARPACCHGMARECGAPGMQMNGSCCQMHRQDAVVAPVLTYSAERSQRLALASRQLVLHPVAFTGDRYGASFAAPPPKLPPGGTSVLRI